MQVTVVDYGRGNLFSLSRALDHLDVPHRLTESAAEVREAACLILPGVGAFGDAMAGLAERGLVEPLKEAVGQGTPLFGICLGMQILASCGEEFGRHDGLSLIPGRVTRLPEGDGGAGSVRIPNVGWRAIRGTIGDPFLGDAASGTMYYFVHSYALIPDDPSHVIATTPINGADVAAIVRKGHVVGSQFHPEKSGPAGLQLLRRFMQFATRHRSAA